MRTGMTVKAWPPLRLLVEMGWHHYPGPPKSFSLTSPVAPSGAHLSGLRLSQHPGSGGGLLGLHRCKDQGAKESCPLLFWGKWVPESDAGEGGSVGQRTAGCRTAPDSAESPFQFPKGKGILLVYKARGSIPWLRIIFHPVVPLFSGSLACTWVDFKCLQALLETSWSRLRNIRFDWNEVFLPGNNGRLRI